MSEEDRSILKFFDKWLQFKINLGLFFVELLVALRDAITLAVKLGAATIFVIAFILFIVAIVQYVQATGLEPLYSALKQLGVLLGL